MVKARIEVDIHKVELWLIFIHFWTNFSQKNIVDKFQLSLNSLTRGSE